MAVTHEFQLDDGRLLCRVWYDAFIKKTRCHITLGDETVQLLFYWGNGFRQVDFVRTMDCGPTNMKWVNCVRNREDVLSWCQTNMCGVKKVG